MKIAIKGANHSSNTDVWIDDVKFSHKIEQVMIILEANEYNQIVIDYFDEHGDYQQDTYFIPAIDLELRVLDG